MINTSQEIQYLFQPITLQLVQQLNKIQIQAQCNLYQRLQIDINPHEMWNHKCPADRLLKIQLKGNYVIEVNYDTDQIISAFLCDISIVFKMVRNNSMEIQQLGDLIGIEFRSQKFKKKNIFLQLHFEDKKRQIKNLQYFGQNLGKKYILQDGFHELYRAIKKIGKGVTASVYKALRLSDKKQVAVKSFKKQLYYQIDNGRGKIAFQKQFKTMTQVSSKYLCQLYGVYESQNSIYIVMELLTRSLYSYLKINGFPGVDFAKEIMVKLLLGLRQMHKNNLMHRDLKLQNIMILQTGLATVEPIIIDFGLAENPTNQNFLYLKCGTPGYVAPQILNLKANMIPSPPYSNKCDIFSIGVIFFILLAGKTVFEGNDQKEVVKKNRQCLIDYEFSNENKLTNPMKQILRNMLQKFPQNRPNIEQLLNHQFFRGIKILKQSEKEIGATTTGYQIEVQYK